MCVCVGDRDLCVYDVAILGESVYDILSVSVRSQETVCVTRLLNLLRYLTLVRQWTQSCIRLLCRISNN